MELLNEVMTKASDYLWNVVLIVLLCGTGIYYTIRLKFVQVRKFKEGLRLGCSDIWYPAIRPREKGR